MHVTSRAQTLVRALACAYERVEARVEALALDILAELLVGARNEVRVGTLVRVRSELHRFVLLVHGLPGVLQPSAPG